MILNGVLQQWRHLDQAYVYQQIHTLSHKARHVTDHIRILNNAAQRLFGFRCDLQRHEVEEQIKQMLEANHTTRNTSVEVVIKLYSTGDYTLEEGVNSIYRGYVLRSLRAEASIIASTAPLADYPTSAMVATRKLMQQIAAARNLHHLVMAEHNGTIVTEAAEPTICIKEYTLCVPSVAVPSVEQKLVERAASNLQLKVERAPLTVQQLKDADEVLILSWQGITAIGHIEGKPYMSIIAERLAQEIESKEIL